MNFDETVNRAEETSKQAAKATTYTNQNNIGNTIIIRDSVEHLPTC